MRGIASFSFMSRFDIVRQLRTAARRFESPYDGATPRSIECCDTNASDAPPPAPPYDPNIGRMLTGCGVGIEALGSPICAQAIKPPLSTNSGLTPKKAGFHS